MNANEREHHGRNDEHMQVEEMVQCHAVETVSCVDELLQILADPRDTNCLPCGNVNRPDRRLVPTEAAAR